MHFKIVINHSLRFRSSFNDIYFKRYFTSLDNKLRYVSPINCNKNTVLSFRSFCHKINNNINKRFETKLKSVDKQNEKHIEIIAKKIPKRSEFFYIIIKKPNELIQWIENTPPEKKKNIIFSAIIRYLLRPVGMICVLCLIYILTHSDVNPITGRETVYSLPQELSDEIENDIFKEIFTKNMESGTFLPSTDPLVKRVDKCFDKLIESNNDLDVIGEGIWKPIVINDDHICDVIVLKESQNVFVYKKIVELCETDDELAYILAHQLSHVMLDHRREPIARLSILFAPLLALLPQLWVLGRDPVLRVDIFNKIDTFLENQIKAFIRKAVTFSPYIHEFEEEADRIAMQLMTRSCFDIRQCRQFCRKFKYLSESNLKLKGEEQKEDCNQDFFKNHPITEQKLLYLFQYIKPFIELRKICNCQPFV